LQVEPTEGTVGERLDATLEVVVAEGTSVERPRLGPEIGPFAVTEISWGEEESSSGAQRWVWRGSVAAFELGALELPSITVNVTGPDGDSELRTEPVGITIRSVIEAGESEPELADLKAPASLPGDYAPLVKALSILAALLLVSAGVWWLHRRYSHGFAKIGTPEDPFRRMPPHVWIYGELQRLLERRLAEGGQVELFFSELSRILKLYLGGRYRLQLMERTTEEVEPELKQAGAPREAVWAAREILDLCDRVKFAGEKPDAESCRAAVDEVYRIADATRPAEAPAAEERGAA
jgi:hypothetical protein